MAPFMDAGQAAHCQGDQLRLGHLHAKAFDRRRREARRFKLPHNDISDGRSGGDQDNGNRAEESAEKQPHHQRPEPVEVHPRCKGSMCERAAQPGHRFVLA